MIRLLTTYSRNTWWLTSYDNLVHVNLHNSQETKDIIWGFTKVQQKIKKISIYSNDINGDWSVNQWLHEMILISMVIIHISNNNQNQINVSIHIKLCKRYMSNLVGGWPTLLEHMKVSCDDDIPNKINVPNQNQFISIHVKGKCHVLYLFNIL